MSFLHKIIALTFVSLWLAACSDDTSSGEVVRRIDQKGESFSPAELFGYVEYLPSMIPDVVRIILLDDKLTPLDSFEVEPFSDDTHINAFFVETRDYEYPYLKLVSEFPAQGKLKKMEFAQYMRLSQNNGGERLNLFGALVAGRIEFLVKDGKKDFDDAQTQALDELGLVLGMDVKAISQNFFEGYEYVDYRELALRGLAPYVLLKHEVSDSVFYSNFKKFRETFAETGTVDSTWMIDAADTWLSTFEDIPEDSENLFFVSRSKDTADGLRGFDRFFIEKAYGMDFSKCRSDATCVVENKSSTYNGRSFVYSDREWRLKFPIDDSLSVCGRDDKLMGEVDGVYYVCKSYSNLWKKESNSDTLLYYGPGQCAMNNYGRLEFIADTLFLCFCEDNWSCSWNRTFVGGNISPGDPFYGMALNKEAEHRFGTCIEGGALDGEKKIIDSIYVECSGSWWSQIDSLKYYLGECWAKYDENLGEIHGRYYQCHKGDWTEIVPPVYFGDTCTNFDDGRVVEYDKSYYICESDACKGADSEDYCWAFGTWRKLDSLEVIRLKED